MRRSILVLFACVLIGTAGQTAPIPKDRQNAGILYYPTRVGDKRVYDDGEIEYPNIVTGVEKRNGWIHVSDEDRVMLGGKTFVIEYCVGVSEKGLFDPRGADKPELDDWFLQVPVKSGDGWELVLKDERKRNIGRRIYTVHGPEPVTVPAGKYQALRVEMCWTHKGESGVPNTIWYAPGVGKVKWTNGELTTVLKSFTPGKE